jgi:ubiquinone biosynthesis protein UbiJ
MAGEQPTVRIEGHVALASELSWLAEHLRWDIEEDLARLLGDAPAHALAQAARRAAQALRAWLPARPGASVFPGGAGAQP